MMDCGYFDTTRNGNHSSFVTPTVVGGWRALPCEIFAESDPSLCERPTPVRSWSYRVTIFHYAFGRWRFGRVILVRGIATPSRFAQNHWQCWLLHNGLYGRRQSQGLSAIAELVVRTYMKWTQARNASEKKQTTTASQLDCSRFSCGCAEERQRLHSSDLITVM